MLHENLGGTVLSASHRFEKCPVIGRNEGKGVLVKPSAPLNRLCTLQVCPGRDWSAEVAAGVAAFAHFDSEFGAAAMAAAVAAASGYFFVETTACGFILGAHISLLDRFVTFAAAFCFVFTTICSCICSTT